MGEKDDCMDLVQTLNERYHRFMSDYSDFYKRGQTEVADSLCRTWKWYLFDISRDIPSYAHAYVATLLQSTDKYVDSVRKGRVEKKDNQSVNEEDEYPLPKWVDGKVLPMRLPSDRKDD